MENCISCGHVKSRHYDALGTGCKETPAGFPCRCEGYIPCPSCAALRAEVERLREVIERNGEMLRLKDIDIDALRAEVEELKGAEIKVHALESVYRKEYAALRAEVERLTNKLNTDSQNFEIIALRETERVLRAEVERYRKITEDGRIYFQNTEEVIARAGDVEGMAKATYVEQVRIADEEAAISHIEVNMLCAAAVSAWILRGGK